MNKVLDAVLIVGFVIVDFFFFHDIFKMGEHVNAPEYLVGILSLLVIIRSVQSLIQK